MVKIEFTPLSLDRKIFPFKKGFKKYCYCREEESGLMIECGKCKEWFHNTCLNLPESTLNQTLLYFCKECILKDSRKSLKIISIDYSKEHTKPLFKKHDILSIFNLYPYYCLIELYKALKFRTPYCVFELFQCIKNATGRSIKTNFFNKTNLIFIVEQSIYRVYYVNILKTLLMYKSLYTLSPIVKNCDFAKSLKP